MLNAQQISNESTPHEQEANADGLVWRALCGTCENVFEHPKEVSTNPYPYGLFCPACREAGRFLMGVLNFKSEASNDYVLFGGSGRVTRKKDEATPDTIQGFAVIASFSFPKLDEFGREGRFVIVDRGDSYPHDRYVASTQFGTNGKLDTEWSQGYYCDKFGDAASIFTKKIADLHLPGTDSSREDNTAGAIRPVGVSNE